MFSHVICAPTSSPHQNCAKCFPRLPYHSLSIPSASKQRNALEQLPFPFPNHQNNKVPSTIPTQHHQTPPTSTFVVINKASTTPTSPSTTDNYRFIAVRFFNHDNLQWLAARENPVASPREARPASMAPRNSRATLARLVSRLVHDFMGGRVVLFCFLVLDRPRDSSSHTPPVAS